MNFEFGRGFELRDQTYGQGFYSVVRRRSCLNPLDMSTGALILASRVGRRIGEGQKPEGGGCQTRG
jgi:hypothetical protein